MLLHATNVISSTGTKEKIHKQGRIPDQKVSFPENNEEILNDEKTSSMLVLGFQYF